MPDSPPEPSRRTVWLLEYRWAASAADAILAVYPAHRANTDRLGAAGDLLAIGTVAETRALAVFTDRDAAGAFARNDPLVGSDLIECVSLRRWSTLLYEASPD